MSSTKEFQTILEGASKEGTSAYEQGAAGARANKENALKKYLQAQKAGSVDASGKYTGGTDLQESIAKAQDSRNALKEWLSSGQIPEGSGVTMGDGVGVTRPTNLSAETGKNDRFHQNKVQAYSKDLGNSSDFNSAIKDVNDLSNADGKGGILSNPDAKLPGTGKIQSALPESALGLGELLHVPGIDKGTTDTRKALSRVVTSYAKMMGGAKGVNPSMIQIDKQTLGYLQSGDPELVKKGVLALAHAAQTKLRTVQSGYDQSVKDDVHNTLGYDPADMYSGLPQTGPAGSKVGAPLPQAQAASPAAPTAAPQAAPSGSAPPAPQGGGVMSFEDWKKANGR